MNLFHTARADTVDNGTNSHEQRPFHQGMVEQMNQCGCQTGCGCKSDSQYHITDLRDTGVGQQPFNVFLIDGVDGGSDNAGDTRHDE